MLSSIFYIDVANRSCKLPLTNPYLGPCSVIVVNNCSIHHAEEIRELVEDDARKLEIKLIGSYTSNNVTIECRLIFLLPYSPDFNPIEQVFSSIKAYLW